MAAEKTEYRVKNSCQQGKLDRSIHLSLGTPFITQSALLDDPNLALFFVCQVDFDRTKHLAESTIKQRAQEREKLIRQEREREEAEKKKKELEELKREQER